MAYTFVYVDFFLYLCDQIWYAHMCAYVGGREIAWCQSRK